MKSSTSCALGRGSTRPSSGRTAPTRRRAPGGSFIWPKTSATSSSTPDSVISSQRSLPSRVRSPTPANTETPPCSRATLWISSWISTVLPTPAPPKRPTLPPRTNGATRSITLMPVSKISIFGCSSSERRRVAVDRPALGVRRRASSPSSIGSPSTFQSRPSVCLPTGTVIGAPVSIDVDAARRGRRWSPSRPRGRGRRRDAAAPPRSGRLSPSGRAIWSARVDLGQLVREDGVDHDALDSRSPCRRSGRCSGQACVSWRGGSGALPRAARWRPAQRRSLAKRARPDPAPGVRLSVPLSAPPPGRRGRGFRRTR